MPRYNASVKAPFLCTLACVVLGFGWEFSTVNSNYDGNWTSLFCTGSAFPPPPALAAERIYLFPRSTGYDGQFYHYVAHDPLYRTEIGRAIPDPAIRYGRILLPALAWLAALGNQHWIDRAYIACNLFFLGLGAWLLARWLVWRKANPALAILYVLAPAALIALDRLTVDLAFTSLCLAFLLYVREKDDAKLYVTLVLAALCRDTGAVLVAACTLDQWIAHRFRRGLCFATAILPAVAWSIYVRLHMPPSPPVPLSAFIPFGGILSILTQPVHYQLPQPICSTAMALDYLEIFGVLLAIAQAVRNVRRRGFGPVELASLLWALIAIAMPRVFWADPYTPGRVLTPLLLFQALGFFAGDGRIALLPLLLVAPRIWLQLGRQALGIVHHLL